MVIAGAYVRVQAAHTDYRDRVQKTVRRPCTLKCVSSLMSIQVPSALKEERIRRTSQGQEEEGSAAHITCADARKCVHRTRRLLYASRSGHGANPLIWNALSKRRIVSRRNEQKSMGGASRECTNTVLVTNWGQNHRLSTQAVSFL